MAEARTGNQAPPATGTGKKGVKSLRELATAVCMKNYKVLYDVGDTPYHLLAPVLAKIDNASQLRQIEMNSPYLEEDMAEQWKRLIARDFPTLSERHRYAPSNPKSWHKIYAKYQKVDADLKVAAEQKLANAFKSIKQDKAQSRSQVINYDSRKLPGLPRDVKPQVGVRPHSHRIGPDMSQLRFGGGSRTKTNTPKNVMKRAIREAKEISARTRLNLASASVKVRPGQIIRAPQGMVQEKMKSARASGAIRPPSMPSRQDQDHERRQRKAKDLNSSKDGSYISDDDLNDFEVKIDDPQTASVGLTVEDLEGLCDEPDTSSEAGPSASVSSPVKGRPFPRKTASPSAGPSTSKVQTETKPTPKPMPSQMKETSPPPKATTTSSSPLGPSTASSSIPPASLGPRPLKRKAVDIFLRPKRKLPRPA